MGALDNFLFHQRVALSAGRPPVLVPLSELRSLDEEAFKIGWAKYDDSPERKGLRETSIPTIKRGWTEVIFLSPVHPHAIWEAWLQLTGESLPRAEFWAIPAEGLTPSTAVVLDRRNSNSKTGDSIEPVSVSPFDPSRYRMMTQTTPENREWLATLAAAGKRGGWWNLTPHVLVSTSINISKAPIVDWADALS